jgi:galactokinase
MHRGVCAFAPGRVNLIGEHTDYNGGLCLPFAIERGLTVRAKAIDGDRIEAHARDLGEQDRFLPRAAEPASGWRAYVRGAAAELAEAGVRLPGARLEISSELPPGGGLASSAALTIATCLALVKLARAEDPPLIDLARLCARVEHDWAGADTGLLDQLAILSARAGHAVRIDTARGVLSPVPLELGGWELCLLDSGARHEHANGSYNARRAECLSACEALRLGSLSEALPDDVNALPAPLDRRARHVITENARVDAMVTALRAHDLPTAGQILNEGHASLRDDYDASTLEVERTVERLRAAGAAGARLVGGGFGGAVLGLFPPDVKPPLDALPVAAGAPASVRIANESVRARPQC